MTVVTIGFVITAMLISYVLTGKTLRRAIAAGIMDIPNDRSSHKIPTPRGGGLAIVAVVCVSTLVLSGLHMVPLRLGIGISGGGLLVAGVGWIDDRRGLSPGIRAITHFAAAAWGLGWLGGFPHLDLGVGTIPLGIVGSLLGLVGIVWMINLYNFMDGIDGLAATEAIMTAGIGSALLFAQGNDGAATLALILAASVMGFLVWNWAPANIFMGDVGSGFLGYVLAILAVSTENDHSLPLLVWIILLGVFVVDATATLLRRALLGEKWYKPHCSHAYQRVTYAGFSHAAVTGVITGINVCLGGVAWICWRWPSFLLPGLFVAVSTLGLLWYFCLRFPAKPSES